MILNICDEMSLLSDENISLMNRACDIAFTLETGYESAPVEISAVSYTHLRAHET